METTRPLVFVLAAVLNMDTRTQRPPVRVVSAIGGSPPVRRCSNPGSSMTVSQCPTVCTACLSSIGRWCPCHPRHIVASREMRGCVPPEGSDRLRSSMCVDRSSSHERLDGGEGDNHTARYSYKPHEALRGIGQAKDREHDAHEYEQNPADDVRPHDPTLPTPRGGVPEVGAPTGASCDVIRRVCILDRRPLLDVRD